MEWREQSTVSCEAAFREAQRWVEEVSKKKFGHRDFRSALENGVLLCDLINRIKPGIIKRVNRLSTPIAGLDNVNVFLKACGKLGLKEAQLFHPGDLQDLSTRVTVKKEETKRRLKNVLITIYWLGRKAQADPFYNGPHLNLKAFEGLLGIALSKALEDSAGQKGSIRDSGFGDGWYAEKDELFSLPSGHRREDSLDSLDSVESRPLNISSDAALKGSSEGCGSDVEPDFGFRMADSKETLQYRRSLVIEPRNTAQFNQFLPSKDRQTGYFPAPLRKKRAERHEDNRRSWASPMYTEEDGTFTSKDRSSTGPAHQNGYASLASPVDWAYDSESDSDAGRPEPDVVLDDLASRRFRSPSPVPPTNYAMPMSPRLLGAPRLFSSAPNTLRKTVAFLSSGASSSPPPGRTRAQVGDVPFSDLYYDSEDEDEDEMGRADPVQDDLYTRKIGLLLQSSISESYNKFLPKFWTPEEDAHVRRIKLGSQRRPWYRKMQGFSKTISSSSSEDSDCDVSPWHAAPPSGRPQSDTPPSHPHVLGSSSHPHLHHLTTQSSHTPPHIVSQPHTSRTAPCQTGSARLDPSCSPRLVKCTNGSTLESLYPSEAYGAMADDLPDLENDDMFARRTNNFLRGTSLASRKFQSRMSAGSPSWPEVAIVTQPRRGASVSPDIERDDLVFRKLNLHKAERPRSVAPDSYHALPIPKPHELPGKLQSRLLCIPCPPESEDEAQGSQEERVPAESDDMLFRRLAAGNPSTACRATPVVPPTCSDKDVDKWLAIREASRLRYKKKLMVERSKSVSEIPEEPTVLRQVRYEDLQKIRAQVKECEDKWQDDLTKWKNRRRSINSDIVKKKEEREQIEQIDSGRSTRGYKTFREMQEDRESGEQVAPSIDAGSLYSASERKPPTRSLPGQSCASDTLCAPADGASVPPTVASQERNRQARSLLPEGPAEVSRDHPGHGHTDPIRPALDNQAGTTQESSAVSSNSKPEDHRPYSSGPLYTSHSMDTKPGMARVSVSLPRSYHRSDSSRLTSVVTPRPFGTQSTKISSLPRTFIMDDSHKRFNGEIESHKPSRYSQFVTSEDETRSQSSSVQSSNEDEDEEERQVDQRNSSSAPQTGRNALQPDLAPKLNSESNAVQEYYSDMRVSLNQKPNSSQDFGFQTDWDSTGAHVKSIRQGSPAELCQLQVGDEILAVGGRLVSKMSYDEWKGSLDAALQQGSLVMDVRRHGKNNWDKDLPSLPYKSHKTINLTSMDTTIVGGPEKYVSSSGKFASIPPRETVTNTEVSSQPVKGQAPKGINGGFRDEPMAVRNQEYEPIALRNFKRRSEFFEQQASSDSASSSLVYLCGGSDSAISDLPVPSISMPSNRWSWDPEEERRRQEKWQKEQERQLQEKYKRDQEVLEETWRRAQLDAMKNNAVRNEEQVISEEAARSAVTLCSPLGPPSEHVLPPFEKHGQEATEPEEEEEGLQREEWQQEAAWLPEQQRKREKQEEEEERRQPEDEKEQRQQKVDEWPKIQEVDEEQCKESRRLQEEQWSGPSYEFAKVLPEISVSDRTKSKSTSELDDVDKPRAKVASGGMSETLWSQRRRGPSLSPAEQERQQILQEMRKKTQLLTDSSWIRQRSISINKEPVALVGPIRRGESLDNLDSARPWRPSSWTSGPASYSRPQSSFSGSSYSRFGASTLPTSLSTGSLRQNAWPPASSPSPPAGGASDESLFKNHPSSQKSRSVSGRKMCTHCDLPLGKGAAMVIESLGLCYHLSCFKCNSCKCDLGGSESGAEVRIRNGQLYCNDCYVRFKTGHPTSM
ncbi:LIM domain only protein 7 isoform X3 [Brienomyrus brachyistius]|uniref:LIM domain only protein 7 isoform X3 n=1 Tax=Brienomyrus brachyistius TaxID=42636 RepID=UPI0020B258B3|nr:LIM domain only protein 7 isoform X3 [Brienomyrus brachyistius]